MAAGPDSVSGSKVAGGTNINGGSEEINGPVATLADDITSINAARQNSLTIPENKSRLSPGGESLMARIYGGKTTDGGY
jgi:hypothetical protein